jgi:hypothetical protein
MLQVKSMLSCIAAVTLAGCSLLTPEWHPQRASASECSAASMEACVIDNYGKRCGCVRTQSVEAMVRAHQ